MILQVDTLPPKFNSSSLKSPLGPQKEACSSSFPNMAKKAAFPVSLRRCNPSRDQRLTFQQSQRWGKSWDVRFKEIYDLFVLLRNLGKWMWSPNWAQESSGKGGSFAPTKDAWTSECLFFWWGRCLTTTRSRCSQSADALAGGGGGKSGANPSHGCNSWCAKRVWGMMPEEARLGTISLGGCFLFDLLN